jgi:SAM-dependent methyltransferase
MVAGTLPEYSKKEIKMKLTVVLDESKPHLGGNSVECNPNTFSPDSWSYVIKKYDIKSVLDVGSGYGHAAKWFAEQGLKSIAIEGLQKNVDNAIYPTTKVDLTESSYKTEVDMVHCVEVVEHVDGKYVHNVLDTLCNGKYIFMTHGQPGQRGHHHVNNQPTSYWIDHLAARGYKHLEQDSIEIKKLSGTGKHIRETGMLFVKV